MKEDRNSSNKQPNPMPTKTGGTTTKTAQSKEKKGNNQDQRRIENQDGGVGRHTAPPRTTRTDRNLKGKEVQHQGDKKINIHPDQ